MEMEPRKPSVDFNLQRMEDIFVREEGKADRPHRHDYYTVLFVEQAVGQHNIDYKTFPFRKHEVHFVAPGQVHQVVLKEKPKGCVFTFSRDFLVQNDIPEHFISNVNLFRPFGDSPPLSLDPVTFERLQRIISDMEFCLPSNFTYRSRALGALLQLFLIYGNNSRNLNTDQLDEENTGVCILRDFKRLVDQQYVQWHKVNEYAKAINISPKHLSHTVKSITGKTAKEIIQDRLVLEAKRLLLHTTMSVKEVAYHIGFEEPLHFSSFFKKKIAVSPSEYRKKNRI